MLPSNTEGVNGTTPSPPPQIQGFRRLETQHAGLLSLLGPITDSKYKNYICNIQCRFPALHGQGSVEGVMTCWTFDVLNDGLPLPVRQGAVRRGAEPLANRSGHRL